jgi:Ca2+:H+ antiporter
MEIGSAYAVQVAMVQIPALVAFSVYWNWGEISTPLHTFTLIFPKWDVIVTIFSVFLLSYTYIEGKSNYFKGSILCFAYIVFLASFYYEPAASHGGLP